MGEIGRLPFWVADLIPLFFFGLASYAILKVRSKTVLISLITLFALISFYLSDIIIMNYWAHLQETIVSKEDLHLIEAYKDMAEMGTFLAFIKAFVLWIVAMILFFFKCKFKIYNITCSK